MNTAAGTSSSLASRLELLNAVVATVADDLPTVIVTPAGFFGSYVDEGGKSHWSGVADLSGLKSQLTNRSHGWPRSLMVAIGVDAAGDDQQQWWVGGCTDRVKTILRENDQREKSTLEERRVEHAGYSLLGFVCGEVYEWPERHLAAGLEDVDVVVVSAHTRVNRTWDPSKTNRRAKRFSFQRRFKLISGRAGAVLAQSRGDDARYVRNCDDWFVTCGGALFPGPRVGVPITGQGTSAT